MSVGSVGGGGGGNWANYQSLGMETASMLEKLGLPDLGAVRVALAVSLFRAGAISAGFAARMADKPLPEMLTLLSSLSIPLTGASAADAVDDLHAGRQWLVGKA